MVKTGAIGFFAICVAARFFRARIRPLVQKLFPQPISEAVLKGLDLVEDLETHELVAILEYRLKEEAEGAAKADANKAAVERVMAALKAQGATDPKP